MSYSGVEKANITYEKNVSIDEVVAEAEVIWAEFKKRKLKPEDTKKLDEFHLEMFDAHKQFAQAYPLILRYMCQLGAYTAKVFRLHIKKLTDSPPKTENDYLDVQADYVVMLYKAFNRWDAKTASKVYNDTRKQLQTESDNFKALLKKHEDEKERTQKHLDKKNTADFAQFFEANKDFFDTDADIKLRTDTADVEDLNDKLLAKLAEEDSEVDVMYLEL
jgi:hypothetical protein